jgi:hypothetical protein
VRGLDCVACSVFVGEDRVGRGWSEAGDRLPKTVQYTSHEDRCLAVETRNGAEARRSRRCQELDYLQEDGEGKMHMAHMHRHICPVSSLWSWNMS